MAKLSTIVETKQQKVFVEKKTQSVLINNLTINDSDIFEALSNQTEAERPIFLKKALKDTKIISISNYYNSKLVLRY